MGLIEIDYAVKLGECVLPKIKTSIIDGTISLQSVLIGISSAILCLPSSIAYQNAPIFSGTLYTGLFKRRTILAPNFSGFQLRLGVRTVSRYMLTRPSSRS